MIEGHRRNHQSTISNQQSTISNGLPHGVLRGWLDFTPALGGTSDSIVVKVRSLDQQSAASFHSPLGWRAHTQRYLPRSSRRLPVALGTRALQRPAS